MRSREEGAIAQLAEALGVTPDAVPGRVVALGGGRRTLGELGVSAGDLGAVTDAALRRTELARMQPPPDREELLGLLSRAL
jgi:hypothetical protein